MDLYKQKYTEALIRAKEFVSKDVVEALEYVFPELAESEDKRIRNAIYNALKYLETEFCWDFIDEVDILDVYAWLEKQDCLEKQRQEDLKKVSIWKHWKDGICGNGEGKQTYLIKMGNTYSLSSCLGFECDYIELSDLDNLMIEKQGKQKQSVWSEEDKQSKNWILEYLYDGLRRTDAQFKDEFKAAIAWFEKQYEKEFDPRYKCLEDLLTADDIHQMSMNEAMVEEAKSKAVNALSKLGISKLLGLEKQGEHAELDESEDKSIRNGLIALLKFGLEDGSAIAPGFNVTKEQALAWIEKQCKQEPASITDEWIEDYWQHEKVNKSLLL